MRDRSRDSQANRTLSLETETSWERDQGMKPGTVCDAARIIREGTAEKGVRTMKDKSDTSVSCPVS